jgi:hypothetical protein
MCLAIPVYGQSSENPVAAFAIGQTLTLVTSEGRVAKEIPLKGPVYDFALSNDQKLLVTVSPDAEHGGNLTLVDLRSRTQTRLTSGPLYFRHLNTDESEVYADLQFSPDGNSIVFGIHGNTNTDGNDAEENSGPFAIYDIASYKTRILKSTTNIDGQGACSEWNPMWSPDGKRILFNCEDGAFITDAQGTTLRNLRMGTDKEALTSAVAWVGNGCVLYVQSHTNASPSDQEHDGIRLFNLRTSLSQISTVLPSLPKQSLGGLRESTDRAAIMQSGFGVVVETSGKVWAFPEIVQDFDGYRSRRVPAAHVIGGWRPSSIPRGCE